MCLLSEVQARELFFRCRLTAIPLLAEQGHGGPCQFVAAIKQRFKPHCMLHRICEMWFFVTLVALVIHQVTPAPSATTVGADLTFLFQNDLNCK
jgi:hypothetical protein